MLSLHLVQLDSCGQVATVFKLTAVFALGTAEFQQLVAAVKSTAVTRAVYSMILEAR